MAEGYKDWSAGDILTAADLEDYTVKQSVMRFADSSARTTALSGVLAEGMMSYLKDTDRVEVYDGSAWAAVGGKILQVVSTTKTDTFSAAISATWTDVTGLNLSITPTSATSKVLITVDCPIISNTTTGGQTFLRVTRDGTAIGVGDAAGSRTRVGFGHIIGSSDRNGSTSFQFLDSPASTSALDYQVEAWSLNYTVLINRYSSDPDNNQYGRSSSTITAMEVSA